MPTRAAGPVPAASRVLTAVEAAQTSAVRLDGDLSDEVWQRASPADDFVQREPAEGAQPTFRTEARVAYDALHLYIGVRAHDPEPARIAGHLTRRDEDSPSDWIRVAIDSFHDRRTAYEFAVNPVGVKRDGYWFDDGNTDMSWDAVWDVAVARVSDGWQAEFRIPFSQLRFNAGADQVFGFAIARHVARLNETSTWPLIARSATGYVSQFGDLANVRLMSSPKKLELLPYTLGSVTTRPHGDNPLVDNTDPDAAIGLDLKYALASGLTLTGTINPDFGQVEADPAVVNLSAFETFFSERRPFFVEGSGAFQFNMDCNDGSCTGLFYSRRIGRPPQGVDDLPGGDGVYTWSPVQTTILGAAKVTGRVGQYSIGVLSAVTQEERARLAGYPGNGTIVVEPAASYSIGRVRREFRNQSSIGFMTTWTARRLDQATRFLAGRALTGGIDFDWRFAPRLAFTGYWAGSRVSGEPLAIERLQTNARHYYQRPDAAYVEFDPLRTSLAGHAGSLGVSKIGGEYVRFNSNVQFKTPGFETNDVGFLRRADTRTMSNWIQFRSNRPNRWFRQRNLNLNQWAGWNFGGDRLYAGFNVNSHYTLLNNWRFGGGFNLNLEQLDDRLTRGGPGGLVDGYRSGWSYLSTDSRKPVAFDTFFGGGWTKHGSWFRDIDPALTFRPRPALSLSAGVRFNRNVVAQQWVEEVAGAAGPHYVFGRLDQTTVGLTGRANFTMTPRLSLQLYVEPFVSAGGYTSFQELVNGRADRYEDRWAPFAYQGNPDFNYKSFRTTNVLRWEYRPGSTLFVVWQQGREGSESTGAFRFGRDFGDVFGLPATNVFLVKMAYWLNR
ncbi:MAG TPA: DUF5916 domain-containing protein [Vicinamibacterales bacterium]|nr:DUF5916 domain-containing protein [Vicinamibacterales bacterium]